jgi:hypothetical protein
MQTTNTSPAEIKAAFAIMQALAEAIRELREVPAGHLFASLQDRLTFGQFEQAIGILKASGLVRESNAHLLTWIEP